MALYQPSFVIPDVRSGMGNGVVDATAGMTVSWRINGPSAMTKFEIRIYTNNSASTLKLNTTTLNGGTPLTTGCPAYGTTSTGEPQMFSYTISAATLSSAGITNGNEYKLVITQWWSSNSSITQSSASVFVTRAAPSLSIGTIGTGGVISTRYYSFTGTYSQAQNDVLNYFRWRIAYADDLDNPFFDSGNVTGTMQLACYYDGFFAGTNYAIRLTAQTENGVDADTGWVSFSCSYAVQTTSGELTASCAPGTDAVLVEWGAIGYIPGTASGPYTLSGGEVSLPTGSTVTWDYVGVGAMNFAAPWSVLWRGKIYNSDANIFTIGQSTGDITLDYTWSTGTLTLAKGGTTLVSQSGIINEPTVTVILTATNLYIRTDYLGGGLYPDTTLYPGTTLYPSDDTTAMSDTYTLSPSYTQTAISSVVIGGYQECDYIQVLKDAPSADTITEAITNGDYEPEQSGDNYMMATFEKDLSAGTLDIGNETIQGFALYRREDNENKLVHICTTDDTVSYIYDYSASSQQGPYTYYLFLVGTSTYIAAPLVSDPIDPCWWNWTLMECAATGDANIFTVVAAYKFRLNVVSGAVTNNNTPSLLPNFTPYPKVQIAPQNYASGTLGGLIGVVDWTSGQPRYMDTLAWKNALYALSVAHSPVFLKNRKGDLWKVRPAGPIVMTTDDKTREQTQTISLPWAEVGSAEDVSLYSVAFVGVQTSGAGGA